MIFARRFFWGTANPYEITQLLDGFVAHPEYLTYPHTKEEARIIAAGLLTDQQHMVWSTHSGKDLTGVVLLSRIVPNVDALIHFIFLDKDLVSKRTLIRNLITYCFNDLGLHRLSMEVPEGVRLERFARKVLNFRLEGEMRPRNTVLPKSLTTDWVARQGSRRESAYFDGNKWSDVVLLRLLASEHGAGNGEVGECRLEPSLGPQPLSPEHSLERSSEAGALKTPKPPSRKTSSPSDSKT